MAAACAARAAAEGRTMRVIILAGGRGTRLQEETAVKPKPMLEVGGRPLLWHVMDIFSSHGLREFVVALGYKGDLIREYFSSYYYRRNDFTVRLGTPDISVVPPLDEPWIVHLVETGMDTATGGRVKRAARHAAHERFLLTYGDGVANVDITALLELHRRHGKLATVTAVQPPPRFGRLALDGDRVVSFREKSRADEGWINGGFFVLEPEVLDYIDGDDTIFEREPLERLAACGQLVAYRHVGFWQCMDTLQDLRKLEALADTGEPPWKVSLQPCPEVMP
jgi:glucose-1-phosphate cytidylyltransferase